MPVLAIAGLVVVVIWLACKRNDVGKDDKIEDNKKNLITDLSGAESPVATTNRAKIPANQVESEIPVALPRDGSQITASWKRVRTPDLYR